MKKSPVASCQSSSAGALGLLLLGVAGAAPATPGDWARAFSGASPALHLRATVVGQGGQSQPLEFWRDASGAAVRRTGARVELRLSPRPDGEDQYQLRDLTGRLAYDVHRLNLFRLGIFTNRWSVQHLVEQPAGAYSLVSGQVDHTALGDCRWVTVQPEGGAATEVCWSEDFGVPLRERVAGRDVLTVTAIEPDASLPAAALPDGWHEFDADEDIAPD